MLSWLVLCLLAAASRAGAVELTAPPSAGGRALDLPVASPRWTGAFSPLSSWIATPEGALACARWGLSPLADPAGAAAALEPLEQSMAAEPGRVEALLTKLADWPKLSAAERRSALEDLSLARAAASPRAAALLARRAALARERGASREELEDLARQAAAFAFYGDSVRPALAELGELLYERRLARVEAELRSFAPKASADDLPSGAVAAGPATLAPPAREPARPRFAEPPKAKKPDFKLRAITAALLVPSIIGVVHLGGAAFVAFTALLAGLSLREYAGMLRAGGRTVQPFIGTLSAVGLALAVALHAPLAPVFAAVVGLSAARELLRKDRDFERAARTVFGAFLLGFLPAHLALVRGLAPFGERITLMLFASAWATDTTAYAFGKRWGSHKIAPSISPNKTWEGAAAGFAGAMAAVLAFWASAPAMLPLWTAVAVGLIMGIAGQASGYLNSMIKRANGVKDSGNLLPGHGGVIDRFDTFILSSALVYFLLSLI